SARNRASAAIPSPQPVLPPNNEKAPRVRRERGTSFRCVPSRPSKVHALCHLMYPPPPVQSPLPPRCGTAVAIPVAAPSSTRRHPTASMLFAVAGALRAFFSLAASSVRLSSTEKPSADRSVAAQSAATNSNATVSAFPAPATLHRFWVTTAQEAPI